MLLKTVIIFIAVIPIALLILGLINSKPHNWEKELEEDYNKHYEAFWEEAMVFSDFSNYKNDDYSKVIYDELGYQYSYSNKNELFFARL